MTQYKECYKSCFIPMCRSTTIKTPGKWFVSVPRDEEIRKKWFTVARREFHLPLPKSAYYCCEDHFDKELDFENYRLVEMFRSKSRTQLKLRKDVVPHKFECQTPRLVTAKSGRKSVVEKLGRKQVVEELLASTNSSASVDCEQTNPEPEPVTALDIEPTNCSNFSIGIQCCPEKTHVGVQAALRTRFKSRFVQATATTTSVLTSPLKRLSNAEIPRETKKMRVQSSSEEEDSEEITTLSSLFTLTSISQDDSSNAFEAYIGSETLNEASLRITTVRLENRPKLYLGIPPQCLFILTFLQQETSCRVRDIMLTLKKIKCNIPFWMLGDDFGIAESSASRIFRDTCPKISAPLGLLVYWPSPRTVKMQLPIPFRKNYRNVICIIDCMEIEIEQPSNPLHQALTWSNYYQCNTVKYLVACTPSGFITFVSDGFGGRISDTELTVESGLIGCLPHGKDIMADRGFKHLDYILSKQNNKLIRPPSVSTGEKLSKLQVSEGRSIASLRVHVERVIGRIREYKIVLPHSTVDNKLVGYLDCIMAIVSGLVNVQSLL